MKLMPVLLANGYMQLMRTATEDTFQSFCRQAGATPWMKVVLTIISMWNSTQGQMYTSERGITVFHSFQQVRNHAQCYNSLAKLSLFVKVIYFYCATACNTTHGIAKAFLSLCLSVRLSVCQTR